MDPKVVCEPAPAPFSCSTGVPGSKPTKLGQTVDYERALNLAPVHASHSQPAILLAERAARRHSQLRPRRSLKYPTLSFSLLSCNQGTVQPAQGPAGRHAYLCLHSQVCRPQFWLWNLKQSWGLVPAPLSHRPGPVLPTPSSDQPGTFPGTWLETHPSVYLVIGPLSEDPTLDTEADPSSSITLPNKVLEAASPTQGWDRIHARLNSW